MKMDRITHSGIIMKFSKIVCSRLLDNSSTASSTRSADPENHTARRLKLEPNMKWIGWSIVEIVIRNFRGRSSVAGRSSSFFTDLIYSFFTRNVAKRSKNTELQSAEAKFKKFCGGFPDPYQRPVRSVIKPLWSGYRLENGTPYRPSLSIVVHSDFQPDYSLGKLFT